MIFKVLVEAEAIWAGVDLSYANLCNAKLKFADFETVNFDNYDF
ncbi:pentapeptide repeat-containing protein [candidate division KSB1 bacterium]|nr:pentapeptide repeat-containing protein [candidate division KSB1 bacterium]